MLGSFLLHSLPPLKFSLSAAQASPPPLRRECRPLVSVLATAAAEYSTHVCMYVRRFVPVCVLLPHNDSERQTSGTNHRLHQQPICCSFAETKSPARLIDDLKRALKRSLFYPQALLCNNNNLHGVCKPRLSYCMLKLDWKCRSHTSVSD